MKLPRALAIAFLLILTGALAGCGPSAAGDTAELTRGQKDTIISKLPIRGSRGVGRALNAVERSQARALAHDSIG